MQFKTTLTLIAAALALVGGQAFAQTDRAAVKADAAAANKKGELKSGEGAPGTEANRKDAKDAGKRADVKAETKDAAAKGTLAKSGEGSTGGAVTRASSKDTKEVEKRADRKAATKDAAKKDTLPKAGEVPAKQ